jgi:hypothetical protein
LSCAATIAAGGVWGLENGYALTVDSADGAFAMV